LFPDKLAVTTRGVARRMGTGSLFDKAVVIDEAS
jgi:hypothetical protein